MSTTPPQQQHNNSQTGHPSPEPSGGADVSPRATSRGRRTPHVRTCRRAARRRRSCARCCLPVGCWFPVGCLARNHFAGARRRGSRFPASGMPLGMCEVLLLCFYCLGNCSVAVAARCSVAGRPLLGARAARRDCLARWGEGGPGGAKRGHCKRRALHPTMTTARASAATLRRPSCALLQTERLSAPRIGDTSQTRG